MKNSETPLYSEEKQEHLIRQEVLGKTKENLTQALNAESYQEDEIKRIYGLEDNFVSPWDKQLAKEQNKPENLIALSEYFLKHPEYDENLTLKHITKLPRGFHFPKNLKGKLSALTAESSYSIRRYKDSDLSNRTLSSRIKKIPKQ